MPRKPILRARVEPDLNARIKALVATHNEGVEPGAPTWDQGDVIRLLLMRSLPGLEAEEGIAPEPAPAPVKRSAKKPAAKRAK